MRHGLLRRSYCAMSHLLYIPWIQSSSSSGPTYCEMMQSNDEHAHAHAHSSMALCIRHRHRKKKKEKKKKKKKKKKNNRNESINATESTAP